MTENLIRLRLFLISYAPLWIIVTVRSFPKKFWNFDHQNILFFSLVFWTLLSFLEAIRLLRGAKRQDAKEFYLGEISDQGGNAAGYLATYLLPFLGVVPSDWREWAAYFIYFFVAISVFIRTDLVLVNPTLYLFKYRVIAANRYRGAERLASQRFSGPPVIIVCRWPDLLADEKAMGVEFGGGFILKQ